jgi:hypothetical protein
MLDHGFGSYKESLYAIWNRKHLNLTESQYNGNVQTYKNLEFIWKAFPDYNARNTLIIDDCPIKTQQQPHNRILISEFKGFKGVNAPTDAVDPELLEIQTLLDKVIRAEDVREILKELDYNNVEPVPAELCVPYAKKRSENSKSKKSKSKKAEVVEYKQRPYSDPADTVEEVTEDESISYSAPKESIVKSKGVESGLSAVESTQQNDTQVYSTSDVIGGVSDGGSDSLEYNRHIEESDTFNGRSVNTYRPTPKSVSSSNQSVDSDSSKRRLRDSYRPAARHLYRDINVDSSSSDRRAIDSYRPKYDSKSGLLDSYRPMYDSTSQSSWEGSSYSRHSIHGSEYSHRNHYDDQGRTYGGQGIKSDRYVHDQSRRPLREVSRDRWEVDSYRPKYGFSKEQSSPDVRYSRFSSINNRSLDYYNERSDENKHRGSYDDYRSKFSSYEHKTSYKEDFRDERIAKGFTKSWNRK